MRPFFILFTHNRADIGEFSWVNVKRVLKEAQFLPTLQSFNVAEVPYQVSQEAQNIIAQDQITLARVALASKAGEKLFAWTLAVIELLELRHQNH